jgi:hypothetical protein
MRSKLAEVLPDGVAEQPATDRAEVGERDSRSDQKLVGDVGFDGAEHKVDPTLRG